MSTPDQPAPDDPESDSETETETESFEPTRTALREHAEAYTELAEQLAKAKHGKLPDPPFDEQLREAVADAQRFVKNARARQIRRLAQLLRETGPLDELRAALAGDTAENRAKQELERMSEDWRARLLEGRDTALAAFMAAHPSADRQRLRQLTRQASRTPPDARSKRAGTHLLRAIRALLAAVAEAEAADPET